ncbi:MAG: hypothetical protein ACE366_21260 [Bradymonadia bacterium]
MQFLEMLTTAPAMVSLFSRTRMTVDYDNNTDMLSGLYLSVTSPWKIGLTAVGSVRPQAAGGEGGIHLLHTQGGLTVFALVSTEFTSERGVSFFSITRYRHPITERWQLYSSAELYTLWREQAHVASVERARLGVEWEGWAFGGALNLGQYGVDWKTDVNPGAFVRKTF